MKRIRYLFESKSSEGRIMNTFEIAKLIGDAPKELLTATETHVLIKLAFFGNKHGGDIRPGVAKIVKHTKLCDKTIRNTLKSLVTKGILRVAFQAKNGSWQPTCYEINIQLLQENGNKEVLINGSYESEYNENTVYTSAVRNSQTPVNNSATPVTGSSNPGNSYHQSTYDLPISTPDLPTTIVELTSNSTSSPEKSSTNLEDEFREPAPESVPEEQPEPIAGDQPKQKNSWTEQVVVIFAYWQQVLNHPKAKLDNKRRSLITSALKMGYSVDELKKAIDGISKTPHNMGRNDRGEVYDGLHVLFSNSEQIERFMRNADSPPTPQPKYTHTGQKKTFVQKNQEQVEMMREVTAKYFPKFSKYFPSHNSAQAQHEVAQPRQEVLINGI